ncbi:MAG: S4 domain-containing protein [Pyrinomonadaceae bacterium]
MRLDLFLNASRLCPRRTVAQQLCDAGLVLINGRPSKSAHPVKIGDRISLRWRDRLLVVRVVTVPARTQISRAEASALTEIVSDTAST